MENLTGQKLNKSFSNLLQISSSGQIYDGAGTLVNIGSGNQNLQSVLNNGNTAYNTGIHLISNDVSNNILTLDVYTQDGGYSALKVNYNYPGDSANTAVQFTSNGTENQDEPGTGKTLEVNNIATGNAIETYSLGGKPIVTYGNGPVAIESNLGNDGKGLVVNSGASSTGNPIEIVKEATTKFSVNQAGAVTATSFTGSLFGTSSWAVSSSKAISSSYSNNSTSASYALTASYAMNAGGGGSTFPYTGNAVITGSLQVSSSLTVTGSLRVSGSITGSLFGTASFAVSSSRAVSSSFAVSASWAPVFPYTGSAKITGSLQVTGPVTVTGFDATINGVTIGRGQGNNQSNTALGNGALGAGPGQGSNTAVGVSALSSITDNGKGNVALGNDALRVNSLGDYNIAIGASAGVRNTEGYNNMLIGARAGRYITTGFSNILIGDNNANYPDATAFDGQNTLSISKGDTALGTGLPHIWAPDTINVQSDFIVNIITVKSAIYSSMFVEYTIEDTNGSLRAGYIKGVWKRDLSKIKWTEDTTDSIGDTSKYVFDIYNAGSENIGLRLTNTDAYYVYCNVTSRLLARPYNP